MPLSVSPSDLGKLLALVVHDIRNPAAAIQANLSYVGDAEAGDPELDAAIEDTAKALSDMMTGLEYVAWIGRWLAGDAPPTLADVFVDAAIDNATRLSGDRRVVVKDVPIHTRLSGGDQLERILGVLLSNCRQYAKSGPILVSARVESGVLLIDLVDDGTPIAESLRAEAFTAAGQSKLKSRTDGRYSRVAGLFAARVLAETLSGTIEAGETEGLALFRVRMPLSAARESPGGAARQKTL